MIPFSPPRTDQKTVDAVSEVLLSGWITTGPKTKEFERRLAEYCGVGKVLCTNSATAGLELALRWFGVGSGDEVIIPAYTYCATANVVMHCGAKPVMVDIDPEDFCMSPQKLEAAITPKTKAVIPVDIGGMPCRYNDLLAMLEATREKFIASNDAQRNLGRPLLLADAAHSFGASFNGKMSGALADISVFSFHAVKNLTTAEGGAIAFDLPDVFEAQSIYNELNTLSLHGQSKDALAKSSGASWKYDVIAPGYKCNMTDIQGAMGLVELERYEQTLARRRAICLRYSEVLSKQEWADIPPFELDGRTSAFHLFLLRIKGITEAQRDGIIQQIFEKEVSVNVHFRPLPELTAYKDCSHSAEDLPNTFDSYRREITLPVYYDLSEADVETVLAAVIDSVNSVLA